MAPEYRLGATPLTSVQIPTGYFRWKVSKAGIGESVAAPTTGGLCSSLWTPQWRLRKECLGLGGASWTDMIAFVGWVGTRTTCRLNQPALACPQLSAQYLSAPMTGSWPRYRKRREETSGKYRRGSLSDAIDDLHRKYAALVNLFFWNPYLGHDRMTKGIKEKPMKKMSAGAFKAHCLTVMKQVQATGEPGRRHQAWSTGRQGCPGRSK